MRIFLSDIIEKTAYVFDVAPEDIKGSSRAGDVMKARLFVYFAARALTDISLPEIARRVGERHHTTVLSGVKRCARVLQRDQRMAAKFQRLMVMLVSGAPIPKPEPVRVPKELPRHPYLTHQDKVKIRAAEASVVRRSRTFGNPTKPVDRVLASIDLTGMDKMSDDDLTSYLVRRHLEQGRAA